MRPAVCAICNSPRSAGSGPCAVCGAPPSDPIRNLPVGTQLQNGKYALGRVLGEGGFGITYQGAHRYLEHPVAIKELFPERAMRHGTTVRVPDRWQRDFDQDRDRCLEEARILSRLNSPGIVDVQDAFLENNTAYLVMEYLEGETLDDRLASVGALQPDEVRRIAVAVCDALAEVHGHELLHRDIKPANIMLTGDGRVVLVDFGSARTFAQGRTVSHTRILTTDYAAPEMFSAKARFDPRTDLYCLGGTLFHALTGQVPPSGMERLQDESIELEFPDTVPSHLGNAIRQTLQVKIGDRPPTVADFRAACTGNVGAVEAPSSTPAGSIPSSEPLWNTDTVSLQHVLGMGSGLAVGCISPDNQTVASFDVGGTDTFDLWDVRTGNLRLPCIAGGILFDLCFSSDSRNLIVVTNTGNGQGEQFAVRVWDVASGTVRYAIDEGVGPPCVSPEGRNFAVLGYDGIVRLWNVASGSLLWGIEEPGGFLFSSDGSTLVILAEDISLWDTTSGHLKSRLNLSMSEIWKVHHVAVSDMGQFMAVVGDGTEGVVVELWDVATESLLHIIDASGHEHVSVDFPRHTSDLCVFGKRSDGIDVQVWDAAHSLLTTFHASGHDHYWVAFNRRTFAYGGTNGEDIRLGDAASGKTLCTLPAPPEGIYILNFSPDGKLLACSGGDGFIYLWNGSGTP